MIYTAYIIQNSLTHRRYIGSTNGMIRRLAEHNRGQNRSTRQKGVWSLIYKEEFETAQEAKTRERQLKSYKGGNSLKKLLEK